MRTCAPLPLHDIIQCACLFLVSGVDRLQSHLWYVVSCMRRSSCFEVAGGQVGPLSFASTYLAAYCKQAAENNRRRSCRLCSLSRPNVELRLCVDRNLVSSSCFPGSGLLRCCAGTPAEIWSLWQIRWRCTCCYCALYTVLENWSSAPAVKRAFIPGSWCHHAISTV